MCWATRRPGDDLPDTVMVRWMFRTLAQAFCRLPDAELWGELRLSESGCCQALRAWVPNAPRRRTAPVAAVSLQLARVRGEPVAGVIAPLAMTGSSRQR